MSRAIVKISDGGTRLPEAGKIKLGIFDGKRPKSIKTLRFTAPVRHNLDQLAALYGGEVTPMRHEKSEHVWQLTSEADEIPVYLPPDSITTWYELWSKGSGRSRQCDGETVGVPTRTEDGWEPVPAPCICAAKERLECAPTTRVKVLLANIDFTGVWTLTTKSWNAKEELPAMVAAIEALTGREMIQAMLGTTSRKTMTVTGPKNFVLPTLRLPFTPEAALGGGASVHALETHPHPAIGPAPERHLELVTPESDPRHFNVVEHMHKHGGSFDDPMHDEIVDAELVVNPLEDAVFEWCHDNRQDFDRLWPGIQHGIEDDEARLKTRVEKLLAGTAVPMGYNQDGSVIWRLS